MNRLEFVEHVAKLSGHNLEEVNRFLSSLFSIIIENEICGNDVEIKNFLRISLVNRNRDGKIDYFFRVVTMGALERSVLSYGRRRL